MKEFWKVMFGNSTPANYLKEPWHCQLAGLVRTWIHLNWLWGPTWSIAVTSLNPIESFPNVSLNILSSLCMSAQQWPMMFLSFWMEPSHHQQNWNLDLNKTPKSFLGSGFPSRKSTRQERRLKLMQAWPGDGWWLSTRPSGCNSLWRVWVGRDNWQVQVIG